MPEQKSGVITIWHDISRDGLSDFYEWHNREHMPERVGIEGFLRGRRYAAEANSPAFFTLYDVRDTSVLAGPAYHARLNDPTPWTKRAGNYFSNEARSLCAVEFDRGVGSGGVIGTVRFDCEPGLDPTVLDRLGAAALEAAAAAGIARVRLCRADVETSRLRNAEQVGHPENDVPRWVVLVEGSTDQAVEDRLAMSFGKDALRALGVARSARGLYCVQHDVVKGA